MIAKDPEREGREEGSGGRRNQVVHEKGQGRGCMHLPLTQVR